MAFFYKPATNRSWNPKANQIKSLKRHVRIYRCLTPEEYQEKWRLPADYPMVAPNYAKVRSMLAKKIGRGQKRGKPPPKHLTMTHGATLPKR